MRPAAFLESSELNNGNGNTRESEVRTAVQNDGNISLRFKDETSDALGYDVLHFQEWESKRFKKDT